MLPLLVVIVLIHNFWEIYMEKSAAIYVEKTKQSNNLNWAKKK